MKKEMGYDEKGFNTCPFNLHCHPMPVAGAWTAIRKFGIMLPFERTIKNDKRNA